MLETALCGVTLKNPVIAASGTFGFGAEYAQFFDVSRLGAICSKGLTLHPREGNPGMRVWETPAGLMNSIGLQNPGIPAFLERELPRMRTMGTVIIANVGGDDLQEYVEGVRLLSEAEGIDIIELNISCPNVHRVAWRSASRLKWQQVSSPPSAVCVGSRLWSSCLRMRRTSPIWP